MPAPPLKFIVDVSAVNEFIPVMFNVNLILSPDITELNEDLVLELNETNGFTLNLVENLLMLYTLELLV